MKFRAFGRTGLSLSVVGLGCGGFGGVGSERELFGKGESEAEAFALMDAAFAIGINYFDTANTYGGGRSEEIVGRWLEQRRLRDAVVVGTKVGTQLADGQGGLSQRHILAEVDRSLRRLQTDWIDLYMAHQVDDTTALEETMQAFESLIAAGKVRYAGVCNWEAWRLAEASSIADQRALTRFASIQNQYNLLALDDQRETIAFASREQIAFMAHSPLAGGLLTGKYLDVESPPVGSRLATRPGPYENFRTRRATNQVLALRLIAQQAGVSMTTLSLGWLFSSPEVTTVLIGPRRPEQVQDALVALKHPLDSAERLEIVETIKHAAASS
jgi:aryl-alcohol dehydrogenase-like predicted oxidoreductase